MEPLEKFIEKRKNQNQFNAMMIPRYLENPDRWIGKKQFTQEMADEATKEALKCKAVLDFLKDYNSKQRKLLKEQNGNKQQ